MDSPSPFVVFGLPRSRTLWLATWLGGGQNLVGHDTIVDCDSPEDFFGLFSRGMLGTVETAGVQGWRLIRARLPGVKFVTIRRGLADVLASLQSVGACFDGTPQEMLLRDTMLDELELCEGCARIEYEDLHRADIRVKLWDFLRGGELDEAWDDKLIRTNIQLHMPTHLAKLASRQTAGQAHAAEVLRLTKELPPCRKSQ